MRRSSSELTSMNGREMAGKRRMVVHIGEHKTGTTSIQYFLHAENLAVARLGYYYPNTSTQGGQLPSSGDTRSSPAMIRV